MVRPSQKSGNLVRLECVYLPRESSFPGYRNVFLLLAHFSVFGFLWSLCNHSSSGGLRLLLYSILNIVFYTFRYPGNELSLGRVQTLLICCRRDYSMSVLGGRQEGWGWRWETEFPLLCRALASQSTKHRYAAKSGFLHECLRFELKSSYLDSISPAQWSLHF